MKIETKSFGEVEILGSCWYGVRNYHKIYGENVPATIGIVTIKDQYGTIKTYIGLGNGLNEKEDIITILEVGVPFYFNDKLQTQLNDANRVLELANGVIDSYAEIDDYFKRWGVND